MIRLRFWAALALAAASPALAQTAPQVSAEQAARTARLGEAIAAIQSGKPGEAVKLLDPLIAEHEKLYASEKRRIYCAESPAETILYMGAAGAAKKDAVAVSSELCIALWAKGFALIDMQQIDPGVSYLERAVSYAPSHPHYLSELGYAYQAQKKWQLSYDHYKRAAAGAELEQGDQRKKSLRRAWFGMAYDAIELGRLEEAENLLKKCLEVAPDDQKVKDELQYVREQRAKKT